MTITTLLGDIFIALGVICMLFGVIGIFKFRNFYPRMLVGSKIDTMGMITLLIGLILRHGLSFFSAKLFLLMGIVLIVNPLMAHIVARSAYLSGHELEGKESQDSQLK